MKKIKELKVEELQEISGGKVTKYPNGLYCDDSTGHCHVDWSEATSSIGQIVVNGWVQNGPWSHR
ncbi:class II bacteriocin [Clostridium saccharobutylicum]|uniref:Class II bacteriocin n=1 Tax=Clostridium saccharobutylicum DSM 13864 TaxID=1345695 RepID=U5MN99_CLOSA|nr:class II bacteriocin [Clostridium saccharobutylicum]AGX41983.1 class II bacteriocin [Clostridium saccharobutylicum DSM 13864]AQR89263.1 bacteriocin hiracin-JM79 precursor [Clostridium saccharobutylicum]AQR99164.1 bacteriocin hiracin-JM79 precursor [Clostridium saccharobutylicum]AQS13152.1 bacteriocin hiracin-JM79 precursor [Clostridium saccharobutylicum]MBA2906241.1 bacteriocin-like protein [Clostridium saccharobutylicum]